MHNMQPDIVNLQQEPIIGSFYVLEEMWEAKINELLAD
jgi:hypothetical protein